MVAMPRGRRRVSKRRRGVRVESGNGTDAGDGSSISSSGRTTDAGDDAHLNSRSWACGGGVRRKRLRRVDEPFAQGNPTDRFVAQWWIRKTDVERRLAAAGPLTLGTGEVAAARPVNSVAVAGDWLESVDVDLSLDARRLVVDIPMGFTEMLARAPDLALAWRICTARIFTTYFDRGYRAVDFLLDRPARKGTYLLTRNWN